MDGQRCTCEFCGASIYDMFYVCGNCSMDVCISCVRRMRRREDGVVCKICRGAHLEPRRFFDGAWRAALRKAEFLVFSGLACRDESPVVRRVIESLRGPSPQMSSEEEVASTPHSPQHRRLRGSSFGTHSHFVLSVHHGFPGALLLGHTADCRVAWRA